MGVKEAITEVSMNFVVKFGSLLPLLLSLYLVQVACILQIDCITSNLSQKECLVLIFNTIGDFTGSLSYANVPGYFTSDPPWEFNEDTYQYYEYDYYYPDSGYTTQHYTNIDAEVVISSLSGIDAIDGSMTTRYL